MVLNSRNKLAELYEWNSNPIEGKILEDYKLKLDVTLSYNETNMKNKSFESQLFEMIKEIKADIANIKVEIAEMKADITVLKGFHNI
ncbi:hypothetical protein EI74_0246 [Mycoplasma testudineum]|uniref:Uncharacterized protein n=2 Tax=Mycoplasma testudineum TaxID=244584 RepID=A0A4R6IGD1_9MOLU|nr:hypothetical protein [Mycoplasma testudineum]TDO21212.1 hypothetical protein EI74_0246 [Mycoplasma testudineum]